MKKITEEEIAKYEQGFEDGYAVAKRLYKPIAFNYTTQSDMDTINLPKPNPKLIKNFNEKTN